jgi:hypothetical protein
MIPSDQFVRFYNEVFKFLEKQPGDALGKYWTEISKHQEMHCLELFRKKGLQGMHEYWEHIRIEENCDMTSELKPDSLILTMNKCPSLSKVMDNDAGAFGRYCDHCPGWVLPLLTKAGYFPVYDIISRTEPRCRMSIFKNEKDAIKAEKKAVLPVK